MLHPPFFQGPARPSLVIFHKPQPQRVEAYIRRQVDKEPLVDLRFKDQSPQEIALAFLNNLAFALGQKPIWQPSYYVGTFSEYNMDAVRPRAIPDDRGT